MARVNVQLRRHNVKVYEAQGVVVDIDSHIVKYNDSVINLTVKEFELLALLIKNKGKAVSREEILDIIWGFDSLETRSVDMHIKSIRKKLGIDIIETVYGFGYKVNV
jgi:two-component system alkaline phosphatase synthesis response regulator PhoP